MRREPDYGAAAGHLTAAYRSVERAKAAIPGYPDHAPDLIAIAEYLQAEAASMVRRSHEAPA